MYCARAGFSRRGLQNVLLYTKVYIGHLHKIHVSLLLAIAMWNMGKFFVLESQSERFMYKEVPWNPSAEAGMCTMNWHLYIIEFIRSKTMFASCFSSEISLSMLTLMAIAARLLCPDAPVQCSKRPKTAS